MIPQAICAAALVRILTILNKKQCLSCRRFMGFRMRCKSRFRESDAQTELLLSEQAFGTHQTELLLSAQDHADEPPSSLYESMIPTTDP